MRTRELPSAGLRQWGTPNIDPQTRGFPYNKDPNKVPPNIVNPHTDNN